jgi:hypothetical protein
MCNKFVYILTATYGMKEDDLPDLKEKGVSNGRNEGQRENEPEPHDRNTPRSPRRG